MAITIRGIRLDSLSVEKDDKGQRKVTGAYSLMSSEDVVIAKQTFNGYSDIQVGLSVETLKHLTKFTAGVKGDLESTLGLVEEKGDKHVD